MKFIKFLIVILLIVCSFFAGIKYSEFKSLKNNTNTMEEIIPTEEDMDQEVYNQNEENLSISEEENIEDAQIIEDMRDGGDFSDNMFNENNNVEDGNVIEQPTVQNQQQPVAPAQQPVAPTVPAQQPVAPTAPTVPAQQQVAPVQQQGTTQNQQQPVAPVQQQNN